MATTNTNDGTRTTIYAALVGIVALAVVGVVFAPEHTINILGFCGIAVAGLFTHLSSLNTAEKVEEKVVVAAQKVEEVKTALVEKDEKLGVQLDALSKVSESTHILVNNKMQLALTSIAGLARWKANSTNDAADEKAAVEAENALSEHKGKQAVVDANAGKVE